MNIYEEYAKTKQSIKLLTDKAKELEPQILAEIANLTAPMKTEHGTFSKVVRTTYKYSAGLVAEEKKYKELVEQKKEEEVQNGTAEKEEATNLRFVEAK